MTWSWKSNLNWFIEFRKAMLSDTIRNIIPTFVFTKQVFQFSSIDGNFWFFVVDVRILEVVVRGDVKFPIMLCQTIYCCFFASLCESHELFDFFPLPWPQLMLQTQQNEPDLYKSLQINYFKTYLPFRYCTVCMSICMTRDCQKDIPVLSLNTRYLTRIFSRHWKVCAVRQQNLLTDNI